MTNWKNLKNDVIVSIKGYIYLGVSPNSWTSIKHILSITSGI